MSILQRQPRSRKGHLSHPIPPNGAVSGRRRIKIATGDDRSARLSRPTSGALRGIGLGSYLDGLEGLGTSYVSTLTFSTDFRGRRDGADRVRLLGYSADCRCFHYTGAPFRA